MGPTALCALGALTAGTAEAPELSATQAFVAAAFFLLLGAAAIPLVRKASRGMLGATPARRDAFRALDFPLVLVLFVLGQGLTVEIYRAAAGLEVLDLEALGVIPALGLSAASQGLTAAAILFLALRRPGGAEALGIRGLTPGARGLFAGACYLLSIPTLMGLGVLTMGIYTAAGAEPPVQDTAVLVEGGLADHPVLIGLLVAGVIPLLEEILFRGFLLELLVARLGVIAGVLLSSSLFALLHGLEVFLPILGLAVVLATVKLRTRSLAAAWFVHAVHNGMTTLLLTQGALPTDLQ